MSPSKRVLFGLTGSISCYKACHVVSRLTQAGVSVQTVATPAALRFVGTATLEGLSGNAVFHDMWEEGHALDHINCAREADIAIVCPATANTINRMASGMADDLIGALFLAWERQSKPWYLAPAMNTLMWQHPATQSSVKRLKEWGCLVIEPAEGMLACGDTGAGRLADPDLITSELLRALGLKKT